MKHRLIRALAALVIALGAVAAPSGTASVHAASKVCTGWTSTVTPPDTIRVYRTAQKRTETIAFRTYVEKVMASEWGPATTAPALRAGAITVKQYAWYFAIHWRGKSDPAGHCYDVVDTTMDQLYVPSRTPSQQQLAAVAATWWISLRKSDEFFPTGYRPGTGHCLAHVNGWLLYQQDAANCVRVYHDTTESVLRRFLSNLSLASPGANDVTNDHRGDAILAVTDPATGVLTVRVVTSDPSYTPVARAQVTQQLDVAAGPTVLGRAAGDVDGNGRVDLVQLVKVKNGVALRVMLAGPRGFAPAVTWWQSSVDPATIVPTGAGGLRLVLADFNGDGIADPGIVRLTDTGTELFVMRSTGTAFGPARRMLAMAQNLQVARFVAADFTGDARADLAIQSEVTTDTAGIATQTRVAVSTPALILAAPVRWALEAAPLKDLTAVAADIDRSGRDDLVLARRSHAATRLLVYRSTGSAFARTWFGPVDPTIPFKSTRFSSADWNGDGRGDLLAFRDLGVDAKGNPLGTRILVYTSTGRTFGRAAPRTDPTLTWSTFTAH